MTDFIQMTEMSGPAATLAVQSASAGASLSMADANFDGVKYHDINKVSTGNQVLTSIVGVAAVVGVASGLAAMWMEASIVAYVAFLIPLFTGPYIVIQRRNLQWMPTFVEESNKLRYSINDLVHQNQILGVENARLERQVQRMKAIEERFEHVVTRDGKNASVLRILIRENAQVQRELQRIQAAQEFLDLFNSLLQADQDKDGIVDDDEIEELVKRMKMFASLRSKDLNEDALRSALAKSVSQRGISSVFNTVQSAMSGEENAVKVQGGEEEVDEDGFVKLMKLARKTDDDEGTVHAPINVEDVAKMSTNV